MYMIIIIFILFSGSLGAASHEEFVRGHTEEQPNISLSFLVFV